MYRDRRFVRDIDIKIRLNELDNKLFETLAEYQGKQKATLIYEYAKRYAEQQVRQQEAVA